MRVVIDTNVIISALISPTAPPGRIIAAWRRKQMIVFTSEAMLAEIREAVHYPRVRARISMSDEEIASVLDDLESAATVRKIPAISPCRYPILTTPSYRSSRRRRGRLHHHRRS